MKYKNESLEGGSLIEQLSAQARQDTALIREQADRIDELQQQLQTEKVSLVTVVMVLSAFTAG